MATYERQIDALGGVDHKQSEDWNTGFTQGLTEAMEIGADADATISELLDCIGELLNGEYRSLATWASHADILVERVGRRLA